MNNITEVSRRDIVDYIFRRGKPFTGRIETTRFLELVWEDCGYHGTYYINLGETKKELWQHTINNYDWDDEYLLHYFFHLLDCEDNQFLCFLEKCIHPLVLSDADEIEEYIRGLNNILKYDGYTFVLKEKLSGKPIYKATNSEKYDYDWDVFICHASEDKQSFVNKLANRLTEKTGEIEFRLVEGSDEFVQLEALLAGFVLAGKGIIK